MSEFEGEFVLTDTDHSALRLSQQILRKSQLTGVLRNTRAQVAGRLQDKSAQIRILGQIADVLLHISGVDLDRLAGAVGGRE